MQPDRKREEESHPGNASTHAGGLGALGLDPLDKAAFDLRRASLNREDGLTEDEVDNARTVVLALLRSFAGYVSPDLQMHSGFRSNTFANLRTGESGEVLLPRGVTQRAWLSGVRAATILGWLDLVYSNRDRGDTPSYWLGRFVLAVNEAGALACQRKAESYMAAAKKIATDGTSWRAAMKSLEEDLTAFGELFPEPADPLYGPTHSQPTRHTACMPTEPGAAEALIERQLGYLATVHERLDGIVRSQSERAGKIRDAMRATFDSPSPALPACEATGLSGPHLPKGTRR